MGNAPEKSPWEPFYTAPSDGSKFDVWAVNPKAPSAPGARFTDVMMRGDGTGFGYIVHFKDEIAWQYLDARDEGAGYPRWVPVCWMRPPHPPLSYPEPDV